MSDALSRRNFLAQTATVAAGAALYSTTTSIAADAPRRAPIRKALKIDMIAGDMPLIEKFKIAKEVGFDGVEAYPGGYTAAQLIEARDATGLLIPGIVNGGGWKVTLSSSDPKERAEAVENLKGAIRLAKEVGATSVLVIAAVVRKDVPYADAYKRSQEEVAKCVPLAEETGVAIAFENVWNSFLLSPLEAARFVDEFKSPMVRWFFDVGNVVRDGWPQHWIPVLGKRIFKLDIKEFSRKKRDAEGLWKGFNVELGEGDCDWPEVMQALRDINYSGWGSAEVPGGDRARLKDISQRMDRIFAM